LPNELARGRRRQLLRHAQGAVAGEGAYLDRPLDAENLNHHRHQASLLDGDLHLGPGHLRRHRPKPRQDVAFTRHGGIAHIVAEDGIEADGSGGHERAAVES
jgi:hypothetical protein